MAKISPLLIFLALEIVRSCDGVQTNALGDTAGEESSGSDSLDLLKNIRLINEISMDEALVGPARYKRSMKGGSVLRRRHARRNALLARYEDEEIGRDGSLSLARHSDHSQQDKRDVSRPFRRHRKTMSENGDRKRSMFLANLLFAQTAKMPQPLDTLFNDSLM